MQLVNLLTIIIYLRASAGGCAWGLFWADGLCQWDFGGGTKAIRRKKALSDERICSFLVRYSWKTREQRGNDVQLCEGQI